MAKKSMRVIGEYTMITAATFVVAAAVYFFLIPSGVSVGSISGLAMLLGNVIPLPISVLTFILNAALLVVGFLFIGREFGVKTVYTSLILPVFLWVFEQVFPDFVSAQPGCDDGYGLLYLCCQRWSGSFVPDECLVGRSGHRGKALKQIFPYGVGKSDGASRHVCGALIRVFQR